MSKALEFQIFCDGGLGNRMNTLLSGLAAAKILGYKPKIIWPRNNWCRAAFEDIFLERPDVSTLTLTDLAGTLDDTVVLLHDQIGADTLRTNFHSAYSYASIEDFCEKISSAGKNVFYYPALVPSWLPNDRVVLEMEECPIKSEIRNAAKEFVKNVIGRPFHGLHLRRTDLNVGYDDMEVQSIVRSHPQDAFFVCSDDPIAEALAAVHPNVYRREKQSYVGKRDANGEWSSQTADDDGRLYFSNIDRGAESVVEAVIDMLILAQSSIVGFSGSTFQNMALMYGKSSALTGIAKPVHEINYLSVNQIVRMLRSASISIGDVPALSARLHDAGRRSEAIDIERIAIEVAINRGISDANVFVLHYNLAAHYLGRGEPYAALLYLEKALLIQPGHYETGVLLSLAKRHANL